MKNFKLTLKLRETSNPHLYINDIKNLIKNDKTLSPIMKNYLSFLKKARVPYIRLASEGELVVSPEQHLHFQRSLNPSITPWNRGDWTKEEIEDYEKDKKAYIKYVLNSYQEMGYDFFNQIEISDEEIEKLKEQTKKKVK